jgi:hypothetical protein
MHWPPPPAVADHDRGPVLVTVQYAVREDKVPEFLSLIVRLGRHRRRDGAFSWSIFEEADRPGRFIETFHDESWRAHLRQHERVTVESRRLQVQIQACLEENTKPVVSHYLSPS